MYLHKHPLIKQVRSLSDAPTVPHYCVLVYTEKSIHHEADERSRLYPGHGYPAYTETVFNIEQYVTLSKDAWSAFVVDLYNDDQYKDKFMAFEVANVGKVKVNISFGV